MVQLANVKVMAVLRGEYIQRVVALVFLGFCETYTDRLGLAVLLLASATASTTLLESYVAR